MILPSFSDLPAYSCSSAANSAKESASRECWIGQSPLLVTRLRNETISADENGKLSWPVMRGDVSRAGCKSTVRRDSQRETLMRFVLFHFCSSLIYYPLIVIHIPPKASPSILASRAIHQQLKSIRKRLLSDSPTRPSAQWNILRALDTSIPVRRRNVESLDKGLCEAEIQLRTLRRQMADVRMKHLNIECHNRTTLRRAFPYTSEACDDCRRSFCDGIVPKYHEPQASLSAQAGFAPNCVNSVERSSTHLL